MKLDQKDEIQVETLAGNMRKIKSEILSEASSSKVSAKYEAAVFSFL